jgi:hypothetical protein
VFSATADVRDFVRTLQHGIDPLAEGFDGVYFVHCRDKLAQAMSLAKAKASGQWHDSQRPSRLITVDEISNGDILQALQDIAEQEDQYRAAFTGRVRQEFCYDDFCTRPELVRTVCDDLGLLVKAAGVAAATSGIQRTPADASGRGTPASAAGLSRRRVRPGGRVEAQKLAGTLSISGVQPKLSMRLEGTRLVAVSRDGQFILKPEPAEFAELPQNESLCMTMARRFGLATPPFLLLELADGALCYVVRRFERFLKGRRVEKLLCEDMHQILGGPDKYAGSHEQIAAALRAHCTFGPLELQRLFEVTLFNFAIGNGDAHRKNFSLLTTDEHTVALDLPPLNVATFRERISGGANQGRARDATRKEVHCGADHREAPRG